MRKCKICRQLFEPTYSSLQVTCTNSLCIIEYANQKKTKKNKDEIKKKREDLKPASQWRKELQQVFNTYIRLRDRGKPCISCGRPLHGKYDAGHFFSVGNYPNLRYHEQNVHGQCTHCNQHRHGNLIEYAHNLPSRIGTSQFNELYTLRNTELRLTIDEIKEKITHYKSLIKTLKP